MKRVHVVAGAITIAVASGARAQIAPSAMIDTARVEIDRAVNQGDTQTLVAARARLERVAAVAPNDPWVHHYIGYALYREAVYRGQKDSLDPKESLAAARTALERSIRLKPIAETHALLSSVLGQSIGSNPLKGMTLGPKSDGEMDKAKRLAPNNPRVWLLSGIGTLFKPSMFGGGLDKAEVQLNKAAELFANDRPEAPAPAWGHAEVYAWLGQIQVKKKDLVAARKMYTRALEVDPDFGWVKYVLLPALDQPHK